MVALLQRLPGLTPAAYRKLVAQSEGHSHGAPASPGATRGADPVEAARDADAEHEVPDDPPHADDGHTHTHDH